MLLKSPTVQTQLTAATVDTHLSVAPPQTHAFVVIKVRNSLQTYKPFLYQATINFLVSLRKLDMLV